MKIKKNVSNYIKNMKISWKYYEKLVKLQQKYENFVKLQWEHEKLVKLWQEECKKFSVINV